VWAYGRGGEQAQLSGVKQEVGGRREQAHEGIGDACRKHGGLVGMVCGDVAACWVAVTTTWGWGVLLLHVCVHGGSSVTVCQVVVWQQLQKHAANGGCSAW
jgi:hypothetical protein